MRGLEHRDARGMVTMEPAVLGKGLFPPPMLVTFHYYNKHLEITNLNMKRACLASRFGRCRAIDTATTEPTGALGGLW